MARGKYAARAANTRDKLEVLAENDELRRRVKELEADNASLVQELKSVKLLHVERLRVLGQQLVDGTSAEVVALREALEASQERAAKLTIQLRERS